MTKIDQTVLYQKQISLTEWFENIKHSVTADLRLEDNDKRERLKELERLIGLPFDKPYQFETSEIATPTPKFLKFLQDHGQELCALRLIPHDPTLPKFRMRGHTIQESLKWFAEQPIDPQDYRADFVPHSEHQLWATIFIVNQNGVFGEITKGGHYQLTQGFYDEGEPIFFKFDFQKWQLSQGNPEAQKTLDQMVTKLKVTDQKLQKQLTKNMQAEFANSYLCGYFEAIVTKEHGLWFIDYNRILGHLYKGFLPSMTVAFSDSIRLSGLVASHGKVSGKAKIVDPEKMSEIEITQEDIIICRMTTPDYLPLMQQAKAIVTDLGGILSHAAIISRELNKPCLTNTKNATQIFSTGDWIEVDTGLGIVRKVLAE